MNDACNTSLSTSGEYCFSYRRALNMQMCIYPMNSPGGYQLVGRTLPIWNMFTRTGPFEQEKPWLLRNFDQIRYFEVSEQELEIMRKDFKNGNLEIKIEKTRFCMDTYNDMVSKEQPKVAEFKQKQRVAMEEQMKIDAAQLEELDQCQEMDDVLESEDKYQGKGGSAIRSQVTGTVWELKAKVGDVVRVGDTLMVLEAMKMEYAVTALEAGTVTDIAVSVGDMVQQGACLCLLENVV